MKLQLLTLIIGLALGTALGWLWRGKGLESGASHTGPEFIATSAEINSGRKNATEQVDERDTTGPSAAAWKLLHNMIRQRQFFLSTPVDLTDFRSALETCETSALKQMLGEISMEFNASREPVNRYGEETAQAILLRLSPLDPEATMESALRMQASAKLTPVIMARMVATESKSYPMRIEPLLQQIRTYDSQFLSFAMAAQLLGKVSKNHLVDLDDFFTTRAIDTSLESLSSAMLLRLGSMYHGESLEGISSVADPELKAAMTSKLINGWMKTDPQGASNWAMAHRDPSAILGCIFTENEVVDLKQLRREFSSISSAEPKSHLALARKLAEDLAATDLDAAVAWCNSLSNQVRINALTVVGSKWIDKDPGAASEWLVKLIPGCQRDQFVGELVRRIEKEDPEAAVRWARTMRIPQRNNTIASALFQWRKIDPEAAARELNSLPEFDRNDVVSLLRKVTDD